MRLFPEVISSFATGCQGWDWHEDAWRPLRMPRTMQPVYENHPLGPILMACPAGVRLRFVSDTTTLWLELRYGKSLRPFYHCDLLVDGVRYNDAGFGPDAEGMHWEGEFFRDESAPGKQRTFDIWFPHSSEVDVVEMRVDDGCDVEPAAPLPVRWLMYGDSITQGFAASLPTKTAWGIAAQAIDAEVFNLAIGGAKLTPQLAQTVPAGPFELISIAYGTNDFNQSATISEYETNARALIENIRTLHPQTPIMLISPPVWIGRINPNAGGHKLSEYRETLAALTQLSPGITHVDGSTLVPEDLSLFVDRVHPNDEGFGHYGKNLTVHAKAAMGLDGI